jgi:class 3 adenylate cyclase
VAFREKHYRWAWEFRAAPDALWPLVSNTDRFNRDCGFPPFKTRPDAPDEAQAEPGVRRLRSRYLGITGEWEEREFEWMQPVRFAVHRTFSCGPLLTMIQSCELSRKAGGGTALVYEMRVTPRNLLGALLVPVSIGMRMRRKALQVLGLYDELARRVSPAAMPGRPAAAVADTRARLGTLPSRLVSEARQPGPLVGSLCDHVATSDDLSASKMRPYELADAWGSDRRETLDLFLHATRAGMLDLSWEVLCPHCRGSKQASSELAGVSGSAHCESCGIDFTVNFDQSVELTFVPNPSVRRVERLEFCVGGPQITPHIVAQKRLGPRESLFVAMSFPEGRYRVRTKGIEIQHAFRIESGAPRTARMEVGSGPAPDDEPAVAPDGVLTVVNADSVPRLAVIERVAWSDQSVTAAVVTSRQIFRDLFSREILRVGERISVGSVTIVFTDLKNSTRLYLDIGDAPAFGRVLTHFDTLKAAIAEGGGAIVKTMGDAVMATFTEPRAAVESLRRAQAALAQPGTKVPLALKCSIHQGPCLAINQNERLDYFGTTVNVCARLCSISTGSDIVVSRQVLEDPGVASLLAEPARRLAARADAASLRGMGHTAFDFWRLQEPDF